MFNVVKGASREMIDADTVERTIDDLIQFGHKSEFFRIAADNFEYRLLDTIPVGFAYFRDSPESCLTGNRRSVHIISDEQIHLSGHRPGIILIEVASEVTSE